MFKIEYVKISDIKPDDGNAKTHPEWQVEQIKKSIQKFGMNDPIGIWKDNTIVEGHGRYLACVELEINEVPVIRLDQLTDEERKAYALVHNKLTMNTDFDMARLQEEIQNINEFDLTDFGFDTEQPQTYFSDEEPPQFTQDTLEDEDMITFMVLVDKDNLDDLQAELDEAGFKYE